MSRIAGRHGAAAAHPGRAAATRALAEADLRALRAVFGDFMKDT
ncbi:hypothetical protein [Gluconacetobacter johannae]|nr:hypothetical protein [Gluconacetobacter johannae]